MCSEDELIGLSGHMPWRDIEIVHTGIGPGEKLSERILISDDVAIDTRHDKIHMCPKRINLV